MRGSGVLGNYGTYLQEIHTHTHTTHIHPNINPLAYVCVCDYIEFDYKKDLGGETYF